MFQWERRYKNITSNILEQIISNKKPANDKTGIGYKSETTKESTSTITEKTGTDLKKSSNHMESVKQRENQISTVQRRSYDRYQKMFNGYCFFVISMDIKLLFVMHSQET